MPVLAGSVCCLCRCGGCSLWCRGLLFCRGFLALIGGRCGRGACRRLAVSLSCSLFALPVPGVLLFAGAVRGRRLLACFGVSVLPFAGSRRCGVLLLAVSCGRLRVLFLLRCLASGCVGLPVPVVRWLPCLVGAVCSVLCRSVASAVLCDSAFFFCAF